MHAIHVIDSHTGGEPTRVVAAGGPELGAGSMQDRLAVFRERFDHFRSAVVNEPRGSDVVVGALLCEPADPSAAAGAIFFNNVGYLGMCGHGTIGLVVTLAQLGRIGTGRHKVETPVGTVTAELHADGSVSVENVPSHRAAAGATIDLGDAPGLVGPRRITGDVAWGGNWFFLCSDHGQAIAPDRAADLTAYAGRVRRAVNAHGFPLVDHVELLGPPTVPGADAANFVLCPGGAYDRSPCGTGTSAKLACLAADGKLAPGATWVQQSVIGSTFAARYRWAGPGDGGDGGGSEISAFPPGAIVPTITGTAYVTAEGKLLLDDRDPLRWGIR